VFVHIIADIYIHVQGQDNFLHGTLAYTMERGCLCGLFYVFFVPRLGCCAAHVWRWDAAAYKHSLYLVLYKMRVNMLNWKTG
jgi:hypothetical protein